MKLLENAEIPFYATYIASKRNGADALTRSDLLDEMLENCKVRIGGEFKRIEPEALTYETANLADVIP